MTAEPENVEGFLRNGLALASKVSGGMAGAGVGLIMGGPPGALLGGALGPFLEHQFTRLAGEFVTRRLGDRQRVRAGAGTLLLASAIEEELAAGRSLRDDDFLDEDELGRRPIDEVAEQAILSMVDSVDERRLPYLSKFYASLYFDRDISRSSIPTLVNVVNSLNFRAMCILNIVGRRLVYTGHERATGEPVVWPVTDHIVAKEAFGLINSSVVVSKSDDQSHHATILGYLDIEPGILQLSSIGRIIFDKMGLADMPANSPDLLETQFSLQNIASSASEEWSIDGGTFGEEPSGPYSRAFAEDDWGEIDTGYNIAVPADEHKKGPSPVVQIQGVSDNGSFEEVMTDVQTREDGTVVVSTANRFRGRVIVA